MFHIPAHKAVAAPAFQFSPAPRPPVVAVAFVQRKNQAYKAYADSRKAVLH